ncbi:MAG: hypothetical protein A2138_04095 [Deltaproteobacteria bacterium RBG_16_71_12]|nr:MAG: hypothetical protein A2138_04095 [Deltaproteobacteria bacterium RBG_16_71_12]
MARVVVVSDATPLIALSSVGQLQLLEKLFGRVLVPLAVWQEVVLEGGPGAPGAREVAQASWLERTQAPALEPSLAKLGRGEAEAIALARTLPDALLLVDDAPARRRARALGVPLMGTLGVLRRAKVAGHLAFLRPVLEHLGEQGFRVHPDLIDGLLRDVGELTD